MAVPAKTELARRRDFLGLFCVLALPARAQRTGALFEVAALDHINLRASDPARSAHFYQALFGGELRWIGKIPPNPTSPAAESWYLMLGENFLSISPTFPKLNLGPDLDHICPALKNYERKAAIASLKARGIETASGGGVWIRDPDGMLYQLRDDHGGGPASPPGQAKPKPGDAPAKGPAPFTPLGIRELTLRVKDLGKAAAFYESIFGGAATPANPGRSRSFRFGDCTLRLVSRGSEPASDTRALERVSIAVQAFSPGRARRLLSDHGIQTRSDTREVVFEDPDGIPVQLTAAG